MLILMMMVDGRCFAHNIIMSEPEDVAENVHTVIQEILQRRLQERYHTTRNIAFTNRVPLRRKLFGTLGSVNTTE
jgi:hypothetical protein